MSVLWDCLLACLLFIHLFVHLFVCSLFTLLPSHNPETQQNTWSLKPNNKTTQPQVFDPWQLFRLVSAVFLASFFEVVFIAQKEYWSCLHSLPAAPSSNSQFWCVDEKTAYSAILSCPISLYCKGRKKEKKLTGQAQENYYWW